VAGDTPLIAGRIHGIRRWTVGWRAGDADLRGYANATWMPGGVPTKARCRGRGRRMAHRSPGPSCSCGLYALHPWEAQVPLPASGDGFPNEICGIIEAWGRVELHANGFRAQYARPIALALVGTHRDSDAGEAVGRLAGRYRAEVIEVASPRELAERCRERGWGLSPEVVRSLLPEDEEPDGESQIPGPVPSPSGPGHSSSRLEQVGEIAWMAFWGLACLLWYGFWAYMAVMVVLAVINGDFGSDGERFSDRKLRVVDEALVRRGDDLRYVAIVRNTSEKRVALAVFARGEVIGRGGDRVVRLGGHRKVDWRPTLLPGETGVVVDELQKPKSLPERLRYETKLLARREPAPEASPPAALGKPSLERASCRLSVPVEAGRRARGSGITIVARDSAGEISAAGSVAFERRAVETGSQLIPLRESGGCPAWLQRVETYPFVISRAAQSDESG
jgi:hypothetical protein